MFQLSIKHKFTVSKQLRGVSLPSRHLITFTWIKSHKRILHSSFRALSSPKNVFKVRRVSADPFLLSLSSVNRVMLLRLRCKVCLLFGFYLISLQLWLKRVGDYNTHLN